MYKTMRNVRRHSTLLIFAGLIFTAPAYALTVDLGASFSQPVLDIKTNDGKETLLAENAAETSVWPYISLQSRERYLGVTNIGYSLSAMFWYFSVDKQKDGGDIVNYDTSIKGYYAYLTPTIYYRFGDRYIMESEDTINWTVGLGMGVGFLVADGDTYTNYSTTPTREDIHVDNAAISFGLFIEAAQNQWFARFSSYGPSSATTRSRFNVHLNDNSIIIGKRISLDKYFQ